MASDNIIQNLISQLGQSQRDRQAPEMAPGFVDIDERGPVDRLQLCQALAKSIRFYPTDGGPTQDWTPFFPFDAVGAELLRSSADGQVTPHLGLLAAFLELHEEQRRVLNGVIGRHLDFQYQRVLGFRNRAAVPDRAHVLFESRKGAPSAPVPQSTELSAGKDAIGVERIYKPVRDAVINAAAVDSLRSIFVDDHVHAAPIANSGDGAGGPLPAGQPGFSPFGDAGMHTGAIGFALSSPILRMQEGTRTVTLSLRLGGGGAPDAAALGASLEAYFTGEKSWLGPYPVAGSASGQLLHLEITIPATGPPQPVVDYAPAVHGGALAADAPVMQLLLKQPAGALSYADLRGLLLRKASIAVDVQGLSSSLVLESDTGALNPKKTFLPFGAQPSKGSRFLIGCPEATSKSLTELVLSIFWHDPPRSFADNYAGYLSHAIDESHFTASVSFEDSRGSEQSLGTHGLFQAGRSDIELRLTPGGGAYKPAITAARQVYALGSSGSMTASATARRLTLLRPVLESFLSSPPPSPTGFITMTLNNGFLQDVFRRKTIENAVNHQPGGAAFTMLSDPYTPAMDAFSLGYKATTSEVDLEAATDDSFSNLDLRFFHIDCFGQRREHGYLRAQLDYVKRKHVPLLPPHNRQGELFVGLTGVAAGDSVSLLFQIADGSADPDIVWPKVRWSVLADNYWRRLHAGDLVRDTSDQLRTSGLVVIDLPPETTTTNTLLPAGRVWLRATVDDSAEGVSKLIAIAANAVEVMFVDRGNDPAHLSAPLPAGSIRKLKTPIASAKAVSQPYASFGARPRESDDAVRIRAAERLRHKGRAITPWDYERLVLEAFPEVHRAKAIPHASRTSWQAPGNVLVVVVPDTRNVNARDPLKPRVDADTLDRITTYLQARAGMQVVVAAKNPRFQKIRLDFKVKLRAGFPFNTYAPILIDAIKSVLSPWASDATQEIVFGGKIYRSALLSFVEQQGYVDYVTDFKMKSYVNTLAGAADVSSVGPDTPDAVLVSDSTHDVAEVP